MVLDNATEAGRMVRGEVTESRLFSQFRAHYRFEARYCNPYSGNEKGSVENAVGFLRRNLLVPVPSFGSMEELNRYLAAGCAGLNAASRARDGRPAPEALADDLVEMRALPGVPFDAVRWVPAKADKLGYVTAAGREYVARPAWHDRRLLGGLRAGTVEILADRGRRVAVLPRAFGEGPAVRNPASLRVVEGGRVPDDATVDVLARRIAAGGAAAAGEADLAVYDGFLKGAVADGR